MNILHRLNTLNAGTDEEEPRIWHTTYRGVRRAEANIGPVQVHAGSRSGANKWAYVAVNTLPGFVVGWDTESGLMRQGFRR